MIFLNNNGLNDVIIVKIAQQEKKAKIKSWENDIAWVLRNTQRVW